MAVIAKRNMEPSGWSDSAVMELQDSDFANPCFCFLCQACIPRRVYLYNSGHCPSCRNKGTKIVWGLMVAGTLANLWIVLQLAV